MKSMINIFIFLFGVQAFAMGTLQIEGKLLRVKNKIAIIKSGDQEIQIPMKKLSKFQAQKVLASSGSQGKAMTLLLTPEVLKKAE